MKIIAANNRANYNYTISNKIEAGIVLTGSEVKSLRNYTGSIRASYISIFPSINREPLPVC